MSTIFASNESTVLINGEAIEGVQGIEYHNQQNRSNVYALGSAERIGMVSGAQSVKGVIEVASTAPTIDAITGETEFQVTANLVHGGTSMTLSFDECYLTNKSFEMNVGDMGTSVYSFTATRVREEISGR